jgi:hypothetical protein
MNQITCAAQPFGVDADRSMATLVGVLCDMIVQ